MVPMAEKLNTKSKNKISQELKDEIAEKLNDLIILHYFCISSYFCLQIKLTQGFESFLSTNYIQLYTNNYKCQLF